jgi:hypothetical protein
MSSYIKHPKGYCYFSQSDIALDILVVFKYLKDKNLIADEKVLQTYEKVLGEVSYEKDDYDYRNYQLKGCFYKYSYMGYYVQAKIEINNENNNQSFQDIQTSFLKTQALYEDLKVLFQYMKQQKHKLSTITTKEFSKHYNYNKSKKNHAENQWNRHGNHYYNKNYEQQKQNFLEKTALEYPEYKIMDIQEEFFNYDRINREFKKIIKNYQLVLDSQGKPLMVEESSSIDQFNDGQCYAIFTTGEGEEEDSILEGYLTQDGYSVDSLSNAKLFSSPSKAKQCMTREGLDGYICEVAMTFKQVERKIGNANISSLDGVISHQEKQKLESVQHSQELAEKLMESLGENQASLKAELNAFLESFNKKVVKKSKI